KGGGEEKEKQQRGREWGEGKCEKKETGPPSVM
ncbi:hypothetical protein VN97_g9922, partial [Penicillium thymicola]